jgi:hypothetical protein
MKRTISIFLSSLTLIVSLSGCAWWLTNSSAFTPVEMCLVNAVAAGELSDPMAIVGSCAGATLTMLETLLGNLLRSALPSADAGVAAEMSPYAARLLVLQQHTHALLAAGVK